MLKNDFVHMTQRFQKHERFFVKKVDLSVFEYRMEYCEHDVPPYVLIFQNTKHMKVTVLMSYRVSTKNYFGSLLFIENGFIIYSLSNRLPSL